MNIHRLILSILCAAVLSGLGSLTSTELSDQAARERARNTVSSQMHLKPDTFLAVERDETLERALALVADRSGDLISIYRVSPAGDEVIEGAIVHHISVDVDPMHIVAVSLTDGTTYRIHGFGKSESLSDFEKLMSALKVHVTGTYQAESVADFYRSVNPENRAELTPILSLLELKQAAERQCQNGTGSFDAGEKAFTSWWKHAEPLYGALTFQQRTLPDGGAFRVEWVVLSAALGENCGGAPLRAQLEVSPDGHVGRMSFSPF